VLCYILVFNIYVHINTYRGKSEDLLQILTPVFSWNLTVLLDLNQNKTFIVLLWLTISLVTGIIDPQCPRVLEWMLDRKILRDSHWLDFFLFYFIGFENNSTARGTARFGLLVHMDIEEGRCIRGWTLNFHGLVVVGVLYNEGFSTYKYNKIYTRINNRGGSVVAG